MTVPDTPLSSADVQTVDPDDDLLDDGAFAVISRAHRLVELQQTREEVAGLRAALSQIRTEIGREPESSRTSVERSVYELAVAALDGAR